MSDAIYDALVERADWLKSEYLAGGNLAVLRAKEEECRYIAKRFIKSEPLHPPAVTALVEAAQRVTNAFYGTSHFADRRPEQEPSMAEHKANDELNNSVANLLTALASFTEKERQP